MKKTIEELKDGIQMLFLRRIKEALEDEDFYTLEDYIPLYNQFMGGVFLQKDTQEEK